MKRIAQAPDYSVTTDGRVISHKRADDRVMRPGKTVKGYPQVTLMVDGKQKSFRVHSLVARAFIPNPEGFVTVNHKNKVKDDNRLENLEWKSNHDNIYHGHHGVDADDAAVVKTYLSGESTTATGRIHGIAPNSVRAALQRKEVRIRGISEGKKLAWAKLQKINV